MSYLSDYLLFIVELATIAALVVLPLLLALSRTRRGRRDAAGSKLEIERLDDHFEDLGLALECALLPAAAGRKRGKDVQRARKARLAAGDRPRCFVCRFDGDLRASAVESLREEITAILAVATPADEIVVVLESGGGTVHGYGLAASQLDRVRQRGLRLRVVVDRIAASGGYMMACVADELVAAPFAIIGSIGVVAQLPNFHRLLKKHDIDYELVTAGEFKRTLTVFGENTASGRAKFQAELEDAHRLFKQFVARYRPALDLDRVASGEWWFATHAQALGLVDHLATSDEILLDAARTHDVVRVRARRHQSMLQRLGARVGALLAMPARP